MCLVLVLFPLFPSESLVGWSSGCVCARMIILKWIIHVGDLKVHVSSTLEIKRYVTKCEQEQKEVCRRLNDPF